MEPWPSLRHGGVLDLNCPKTGYYLKQISEEKMFGMHTEWILLDVIRNLTSNTEGEIITSDGILLASESYALPGSCVRVVQIISDTAIVYYYNMYRITMREPMRFLLELAAPIRHLPNNTLVQCSYLNRSNFEGAVLLVASTVEFPDKFHGFESQEDMEIDLWPRVHYPMTVLLSEQLNYKLNITISNSFGWLLNTTYFDGMIGMLQREEADIGGSAIFVRHDRMDAAQFCAETYHPRTAVLFKQPPLSSAYNIFLLPFTSSVWITCAILSLLVTAILSLEYYLFKHKISRSYQQKNAEYTDVLTMVISTICQQGTELMPELVTSRIVVFIFSLAAFLLYAAHSANIVALIQSTAPVLKSLNDITKSHLAIKIQDLRYNRKFFKETNDPKIIDLYKKKVEPFGENAYCIPEDGIRLMRSGKYAYSVEVNAGYRLISKTFEETEKCGLGETKMFFSPKLSLPVVKKSGHREHITRMMAWQREVGFLQRIASIWFPPKPACNGQSIGFTSVGLIDFLPALLVFTYGSAITLVIFLMEVAFHYGCRKYEDRKLNQQKGWTLKPIFRNELNLLY